MEHTARPLARRAGRVMLIAASVLAAGVLILLGLLLAVSPGKPKPFLDGNGKPLAGSLSEKIHININGVEQGMFIKSRDVTHPVLLYLHGGMPDYFLTQSYPIQLEDHFTVVWWEQRGSGLSYRPGIPRETMTVEQLVSDTLALTNYLRDRFGVDKIYLMGHSGGSLIGIKAAARAPELYYAYIGTAQMSDQLTSEKLAYDYMLAQYRANGNTSMVRKLEAAPVTLEGGVPASYDMLRDTAMHGLGIGTTHDMRSVLTGIILPSFAFREYTLGEKINLWRGKARGGISAVWNEMVDTDLSKEVPAVDVPVYFLEGAYDYTVSSTEARAYFEKLKAPVKGYYVFEKSAHSPLFEEPDKALRILLEDVLAGKNTLADEK